MKKRVISLLLIFAFAFSGISAKLYSISAPNSAYASKSYGTRALEISETRGCIYDRNLKKLVNNGSKNVVIIKPSPAVKSKLSNSAHEKEVLSALENGSFFICEEKEGVFQTDENILNLKTVTRYTENRLCHIIGYTNAENTGVCGIEKAYDSILKNSGGTLSAIYKTDALGNFLISESIEIRNDNYDSVSGVVLTIDNRIQDIVYNAMVNGNITKGAAVVLNIKTGETVACVSLPLYSQNEPEKSLSSDESPFLNRAFSAYTVGSVFKVVTAAAALEANIKQEGFICNGHTQKSGVTFYCNNTSGHGELTLNKALCVSCNPYFIELSIKIGAEKMTECAKAFGFSKKIELNGITTESGTLPDAATLDSEAAIGNFGFGQGELTATPLQLAACYSTLASGGIYRTPYLVKGIVNLNGEFEEYENGSEKQIIKPETAETINECLFNTVNEGTGIAAKSKFFNACGKTATAETGQTDKNGRPIYNTWFVGFFPYESPLYTVCILKEDGASGSYDDAPIFKEISENIYFLEDGN